MYARALTAKCSETSPQFLRIQRSSDGSSTFVRPDSEDQSVPGFNGVLRRPSGLCCVVQYRSRVVGGANVEIQESKSLE